MRTRYIMFALFAVICQAASGRDSHITDSTAVLDTASYGFHANDAVPEFTTIDQLKAASFLNECINTLTRIEKSESKIVLEEEKYRLDNILGWKGTTDYTSVVRFRKNLVGSLNEMIINEIDKERYIKAYERKQNRAAKDAFLNAISGVQLNVNLTSVVSNILIASARSYMDYNKRKEELGTELDDELWKLEIEQLNEIAELKKSLMEVYNEVYSEYGLENEMSLTSEEIETFYDILLLPDSRIKTQSLIDKSKTLRYFAPYWFERGCAFVELYEEELKDGKENIANLNEAWRAFARYESMYNQCVLYRYDYRLGMIALYKLKYMDGLSREQREQLAEKVLFNIRDDGNAMLYVAIEYIETLDNVNKGFDLMRQALQNKASSAHNEIVLAAGAYWDKLENKNIKDLFIRTLCNAKDVDLDAYIAFLYKVEKDKSVNSYPLKLKLQNSVMLTPIELDDDEEFWSSLKLECRAETFWFNDHDWTLSMEKIDGEQETAIKYTFVQQPDGLDEKFFESSDDAREKIMSKVPYFKKYPLELDRTAPFSRIYVNGKFYWYLSKTFSDISAACQFIDNSGKKYDSRAEFEQKYANFCNDYLVSKIEYQYRLDEEPVQRTPSLPNGTKYTYKVSFPHSSSDSSSKFDVHLCYQTDYIIETDPYLYFSGVIFNNEYIRF